MSHCFGVNVECPPLAATPLVLTLCHVSYLCDLRLFIVLVMIIIFILQPIWNKLLQFFEMYCFKPLSFQDAINRTLIYSTLPVIAVVYTYYYSIILSSIPFTLKGYPLGMIDHLTS